MISDMPDVKKRKFAGVHSLALKVENFHTAGGGGAQPVSVW